ncbi:DUF2322 family protein [Epibacterium sp. SM1969]|uniref:DUF2322 family protein n=1 Tax=Tritonibacter aquimaris TaxID=2663379 RepID=A0A844AYN9_9RHOB|nr:DUF2322 family protein [Tritonibacter aquimaris]MQY43454.1 DUF2322 family protein [Tritonibacter aquimaris]
MIKPSPAFKDNIALLPAIDGLARIDLLDASGAVVATIENKPGKQGSLAVYQYLAQSFDALDASAAAHGVEVFAEHTEDAKNRPGAHPNIDLLLDIINGGGTLTIRIVKD